MPKKKIDPELVELAAFALNCEFLRKFRQIVEQTLAAAECFDEETQQNVKDRLVDESNPCAALFLNRSPDEHIKITGESGKVYKNMLQAVSARPAEPIFIDGIKYFTLKDGELYWAK